MPFRSGSAAHGIRALNRIASPPGAVASHCRRQAPANPRRPSPAYPSRRLLHLVSDRIASQRIHLGGRPRRRRIEERRKKTAAGYYKTWAAPNTPRFDTRIGTSTIASSSRTGRSFLAAFSYHPPSSLVIPTVLAHAGAFPSHKNRLDERHLSPSPRAVEAARNHILTSCILHSTAPWRRPKNRRRLC